MSRCKVSGEEDTAQVDDRGRKETNFFEGTETEKAKDRENDARRIYHADVLPMRKPQERC